VVLRTLRGTEQATEFADLGVHVRPTEDGVCRRRLDEGRVERLILKSKEAGVVLVEQLRQQCAPCGVVVGSAAIDPVPLPGRVIVKRQGDLTPGPRRGALKSTDREPHAAVGREWSPSGARLVKVVADEVHQRDGDVNIRRVRHPMSFVVK
jgi:hypothetical protein